VVLPTSWRAGVVEGVAEYDFVDVLDLLPLRVGVFEAVPVRVLVTVTLLVNVDVGVSYGDAPVLMVAVGVGGTVAEGAILDVIVGVSGLEGETVDVPLEVEEGVALLVGLPDGVTLDVGV
jgi:hypothetical protein